MMSGSRSEPVVDRWALYNRAGGSLRGTSKSD